MWKTRFAELLADREPGAQALADANELKRQHLPDALYKYRCFDERTLEILRSDNVWLSSPASFNDPLDCAVTFDVQRVVDDIATRRETDGSKGSSALVRMIRGENFGLPSEVRSALVEATTKLYRHLAKPLVEHATGRYRSGLRICCFSESVTSVPMWAHYAGLHTGLCIEWTMSDWRSTPDIVENIFPVLYDTKPYQMPSLAINPSHAGAELVLALRKALDWSYEKEWRYVLQTASAASGCLQRLTRPSAVHLGLLMPAPEKQTVVRLCNERGIKVSQMRCDLERGYLAVGELIETR